MKAEGPPKILRALVNIVVAGLLMLQPSPGKLAGSCVSAVALLSIGAVSTALLALAVFTAWAFCHGHSHGMIHGHGVAGAAGQGGPLCDVHHRAEPGAAALLLPLALPQIRRKVSAQQPRTRPPLGCTIMIDRRPCCCSSQYLGLCGHLILSAYAAAINDDVG